MQDLQLRLRAKRGSQGVLHVQGTNTNGFEWQVVTLLDGQEADAIIHSGEDFDMTKAATEGCTALLNELRKPMGPVRHDWECSCGCQLSMEARRSKTNPYGWDTPREIACNCGRVYGVKLNFAERTAEPRLEHVYRTTTSTHAAT